MRSVCVPLGPASIGAKLKKRIKSESGINKNRDPATAQVSVEMKIKHQKAFCGRNKLKSVSRFCEPSAMPARATVYDYHTRSALV